MKLICMAFDGDFVTEQKRVDVGQYEPFDTIEEAWEHSNDLGSKWFFFPFHFVTSDSTLTIVDAPEPFKPLEGKRTATLVKHFEALHKLPEAQNMDVDQYAYFAMNKFLEKS